MTAPYRADSYQGIIDAFNTLRASQGEEKKYYEPNFQGIIEAILDLKKWGQAGDGETPPGWYPIIDGDGNIIGGDYNPPPDNGTLWFDERQGRLFTWVDDGWYQTNGGDGLPHIGENPPSSQIPGQFWFNTLTEVLYIYSGDTWIVVTAADAGTSTSTLMLSDQTKQTFRSGVSDVFSQADLNKWVINALGEIEDDVAENAGQFQVYTSATAPTNAKEGDLWYNTSSSELLIWHQGSWELSAPQSVTPADFSALTNQVNQNKEDSDTSLDQAFNQIQALENKPDPEVTLTYDPINTGLRLIRPDGETNSINFYGRHGIELQAGNKGIIFDTSVLENALSELQRTSARQEDVEYVDDRLVIAEHEITTLKNTTHVNPADFSDLSSQVNGLPTKDDLDKKLNKTGGTMLGHINMTAQRIREVGVPVENTDAARKVDVDAVKEYADNTFMQKNFGIIGHLNVSKNDVAKPVIDFSENASNGQQAFKFKTYGNPNDVVKFGTTENQWEYAWNFDSKEDFCWVHDGSGKQVSINHEGLTARKLYLGTFLPNTSEGTQVMNKIDVGHCIETHTEALQLIKTAVVNSDSYEEFREYIVAKLVEIC